MLNLRSEREIRLMRKAGRLVARAHQLAAQMVKPGVTTGQIDAVIEKLFQQEGAQPLFKGAPGKVPFPAVTCTSVNEEVVHGIPGDRVLAEGDIISIDTGCKLDGWCGDAAFTHPVGRVAAEVQKLLDVARGALELAIELMGQKGRWSEVAQQIDRYVHDYGFSVVRDLSGHGIGRQMHEEPQVPNYNSRELRRSGDFPLRPGLVIAVEPMVNFGTAKVKCLPDHWTHVTADGKWSAHFEHTIALTKGGPSILTREPADEVD